MADVTQHLEARRADSISAAETFSARITRQAFALVAALVAKPGIV
jgi:hypothetical protein